MITPNENYEQDKIIGKEKQTVILNEMETSETDELDPKFHEDKSAASAPANVESVSGEEGTEDQAVDPHLNHDADDDLSMNKPADELF